jgi:hypothetical protein
MKSASAHMHGAAACEAAARRPGAAPAAAQSACSAEASVYTHIAVSVQLRAATRDARGA